MADVTPSIPEGRQVIETYGEGRFRISGEIWQGSVIVMPERTVEWRPTAWAEVDLDSFGGLLEWQGAEVLLVGCGQRMEMVSGSLRRNLRAAGMVVETMDTGAACRTYNILLAEDRRVAAALIAV